MRETESLLIAIQNNAINSNYVKSRRDKTEQKENVGYVVLEMKRSIIKKSKKKKRISAERV